MNRSGWSGTVRSFVTNQFDAPLYQNQGRETGDAKAEYDRRMLTGINVNDPRSQARWALQPVGQLRLLMPDVVGDCWRVKNQQYRRIGVGGNRRVCVKHKRCDQNQS